MRNNRFEKSGWGKLCLCCLTGLLIFGSGCRQKNRIASPWIIAHRGGVVDDSLSENSFKGLDEAIRRGYTHVEIDARLTADGHMVCFHHDDLLEQTGIDNKISRLPLQEVVQIVLTRSQETIPTFADYSARCKGRIQVMVDVKGCEDKFVDSYVNQVETALRENDLLDQALILINKEPRNNQAVIAERFLGKARVSLRRSLAEVQELCARDADLPKQYYIFNHGADFTAQDVKGFQELGFPVVVSVNTAHYKSGDPHEQGLAHIRQALKYGVDGLQIDSCYDPLVFSLIN